MPAYECTTKSGDFAEMIQTLEAIVNPFKGLESESPDNVKKVELIQDENVRIALEKYDEALHEFKSRINEPTFSSLMITAGQKVPPLTPAQIDHVLQIISASRETPMLIFEDYVEWRLYHSYKAGHRKFVLNFRDYLPYKIHLDAVEDGATIVVNGNSPTAWWSDIGQGSKNVTYIINGKVGRDIGSDTARCTFFANSDIDECGKHSGLGKFYIKGNINELGNSSEESKFSVIGNVKNCGINARHSEFLIKGSCDYIGNYAENCKFIVKGGVLLRLGDELKSKNCTYVVYNEEAKKRLDECLDGSNKVILKQ